MRFYICEANSWIVKTETFGQSICLRMLNCVPLLCANGDASMILVDRADGIPR